MRLCSMLLVVMLGLAVSSSAQNADRIALPNTNGKIVLNGGFVDSGGVKVHYYTLGKGPLLILLHGAGQTWVDWHNQIPVLAKNYQVVSLDNRSRNLSDKLTGPENFTMDKMVEDVNAALRHFKAEKATIVGHDIGGITAFAFAMRHPEKTERIVVLNGYHPGALLKELVTNPAAAKLSQGQRAFSEDPDIIAKTRQRQLAPIEPTSWRSPDVVKIRQEVMQLSNPESQVDWYRANWPKFPYSAEMDGFGGKGDHYPLVKSPVLLMLTVAGPTGGGYSGTLNDMLKRVERDLTIVTIPGVGHNAMEEKADYITRRIVDWLAATGEVPLASSGRATN